MHINVHIHTNTSIYYFTVDCDDHSVSLRNYAKRAIKRAYKILYDCCSHTTVKIDDVVSEKHNVISVYVRENYFQI